MAEPNKLDGLNLPERFRKFIEAAPPHIKEKLTKALVEGRRVGFVEIDERTPEKKETKDPINALKKMLLNPPTTLEMLKVVVTDCLAEAKTTCAACRGEAPLSGERLSAPCLLGKTSVEEVLLSGILTITRRWTRKKKIELFTKTFGVTREAVLNVIKEELG